MSPQEKLFWKDLILSSQFLVFVYLEIQTSSFSDQVWEALKILDAADIDKPDASPEVYGLYTDESLSFMITN